MRIDRIYTVTMFVTIYTTDVFGFLRWNKHQSALNYSFYSPKSLSLGRGTQNKTTIPRTIPAVVTFKTRNHVS